MAALPSFALGPWGYVAVALAASVATWYVTDRVKQASYDELVIAQKQAVIDAKTIAALTQKNQDIIIQQDAVKEAKNQQALEDKNNATIKHIPIYVQDSAHCITFGLIRVLDAAATNRDPAELDATGKPSASCSPITNTALAQSIATNYGIANQNAEQLDALEASVISLHETTVQPASKPSWWERNFGSL